ncbi:MAG: tRNA (adenosine(37)-N6)-dimethylallyltransferase MiaA [Sedimentisphaerales bacterium]|nr:tRNA (adenosine(37)-N6)-dimethylallyltransferase MiaA [Sedimentisphaerales bacterium]
MSAKMVLILGCTASGKGGAAFELAKMVGGQILSIDSMKVYRRMDIGTAKPSEQRRREVVHHLIDVVEPSEAFSVGRFVEMADQVIDELQQAESPIIAAGGTAMYIRGLIEGIFDGPGADTAIREQLIEQAENAGLGKLHERLVQVDPDAGKRIHPNDRKRIIRALEVYELTGKPISSFQNHFRSGNYRHDWVIIGLRRNKEEASGRINQRVKRMIDKGLVEEVESLLKEPEGLSSQAAQAVGYAEIIDYLQGRISLDEAVEKIKINTRRLAKRQRTWFRSFAGVNWIDLDEESTAEKTAQMMVDLL